MCYKGQNRELAWTRKLSLDRPEDYLRDLRTKEVEIWPRQIMLPLNPPNGS